MIRAGIKIVPSRVLALLLPAVVLFAVVRSNAAEPVQVKAAVEKSISLLQQSDPEFFRQSGCVACHQHSMASLAVGEARRRGFTCDDDLAREQLQITALTVKSYRDRFLERVDHPVASAPSVGYISLGLAAENYPADEITDAMIVALVARQRTDGSWTAFGHRPPLEYSRIGATALGLRAIQLYGPPGLKKELDGRIARARDWLIAAEPATNAEHALRLLGLAWGGADRKLIETEITWLKQDQRSDGGWAQLPELDSDAYATGLTLFALHTGGGVPASDPAYQRGADYLLKTQLPDGSWHVTSRSFPFQPYFESGFPHGHDQWISATATGFAAVALMYTAPEKSAAK